MAISGGDGSIILTTKVDTNGLDAAMAKMRQQAKGTGSAFESLSNFIKIQEMRLASLRQQYASYVLKNEQGSVAAKKLAIDIKKLSTSLTQNQARLNAASASAVSFGAKAKTAIAGVGASLKVLASYLIGIQTIFAVINFSKQSAEFATQTEASVQRLIDIYGEASQAVGDYIDANARALGMSKASASSFASVYGNLFSVWADQNTNAELTNRYLNMTAVVASKTGRTVQDVQERIRSGLLGNTEAIEDLGVFVNVKTIEMTDAFKRMADGRSWEQLDAYTQQQVRTMAILEQATAKYGNTVADTTATTRAQYQAAYEDFQNTWGQVLNTVLIPVLKVLTQVFTIATKGLQVLAGLSGKTVDNSKIQESSIGGAVDNQKALTKAVKDTAKAQKSLTAEFDELNILSQENASASSGTGTTGGANVSDLGLGDVGGNYDSSFVDQIDVDLAAIMGYVGFALAAIGIILICFGHIGWGIGFLIAGATLFSVSQAALSEGAEAKKVKNIMNGIIAGISLLALILGIILVCTTKNPKTLALGIGLIVVGAAGLATEIALNWNAIKENVQKFFTENGALIAGISFGLLVIGVLLCFAHQWGLGIGLIAAGAVGLATTIAINWNAIKNAVTKFIDENTGLIVGVAAALLILGVILCLCGVITPLSIGLIVAGAGSLAGEVALNPQEVGKKIKKFFKDNAWIMAGVSLVLLIIGIILCFTPMLALGIGLIAAGAVSLGATVALNWNAIVDNIKKFVFENPELIALISGGLLILGIILCFVNLPLGISLIAVGAIGLVTIAALNWNAIVDNIKKFVFKNSTIISLISGGLIILGILLCFVVLPLGLSLIAAGAVGLAAVVAVNWNTIKEKVSNAFNAVMTWIKTYGLLVIGILLCLTGAGISLGIALIIKWAKDGAEKGVPLANVIVDKVKQVWNAVKQFWNTHIAKWFTKEHWAGLAKNMMNGLIEKIEAGLNKLLKKFHDANIGKALDFIAGGLGFEIPRSISIPRLAQGAVIPPNREFLAVLGDQKHGTNIEAPLDTIKQAVAEVLAQVNVGGSGYNGRIEVPVIIDGREIARAVRQAEGNMGTQTVFGGFANVY